MKVMPANGERHTKHPRGALQGFLLLWKTALENLPREAPKKEVHETPGSFSKLNLGVLLTYKTQKSKIVLHTKDAFETQR